MGDRVDGSAKDLDDVEDREELRQRYYGLLQELRVVLPGVQVLLAFLFTVPFAQRFTELDALERDLYGVSMVSALLAVICLLSPTVFHRLAERTARSIRLVWGVRMVMVGLVLVAISLTSALWCVSRFVFGNALAVAVTIPAVVAIIVLWVILPLAVGRNRP